MNIKIESPVVLEVKILEYKDAEVILQRQVSHWLQRVYGATPPPDFRPNHMLRIIVRSRCTSSPK
jgi:hypothetical protein